MFVFNIQIHNDYAFSLLPPKSLTLIASPLPRTCGPLVSFVMFCKFFDTKTNFSFLPSKWKILRLNYSGYFRFLFKI